MTHRFAPLLLLFLVAAAPSTRPAPPAPPAEGPIANMALRLREHLQELDLSADQKARIKSLFDDVREKGEELRREAQMGVDDARGRARELFLDTRKQLGEILTAEQREKMREIMRPGAGAGADRRPP